MLSGYSIKCKAAGSFVASLGILITILFLLSSSAFAQGTWVTCTPESGASYDNRVHVKCTESYSGIQYFAISTKNKAEAARALSIISTSIVAGKTLSMLYIPADTSGTSLGCMESDCRLFYGIALNQ